MSKPEKNSSVNSLIKKVYLELEKNIDLEYKKNSQNFFKEKIKTRGVRTPITRKISARFFPKNIKKEEIFSLCKTFLSSGYNEDALIAFDWSFRIRARFEPRDFFIFKSWIKNYIDNWAKCDDFCCHSLGFFLKTYPDFFEQTKTWTKSKNRWLRRTSAVCLIYPTRKRDDFLEKNFQTADLLLTDKDDMVRKGYGWMLKEAANKYENEVFAYVLKNKTKMPRVSLRYAIEKMNKTKRQQALIK